MGAKRHQESRMANSFTVKATTAVGGKRNADVERYAEWEYQHYGRCNPRGPKRFEQCARDLAAGRGVSRRVRLHSQTGRFAMAGR